MIKYNLDPEGYITEIGFVENYQYPLEENSPVNMENFQQYRMVDGAWVRLTPEQFLEKYGIEL